MADRSVLFTPPMNTVPEAGGDKTIIVVPLKSMDWANRPSQQKAWDKDIGGVKNIPNGR